MKLLSLIAIVLYMITSPFMAQSLDIESDRLDDLGVRLPQPTIVAPRGSQEFWVCTFNNRGSDWVPVTVGVALLSPDSASVVDSVLTHFGQSPVQATIFRNDDRILGVWWRVLSAKDKRGRRAVSIDYTLRFNKKRNKANLDVAPFIFSNFFNGRGTCTRR